MSRTCWQKSGIAVDADIQRFLAGDDVCCWTANSSCTTSPPAKTHVEGCTSACSTDERDTLFTELKTWRSIFRRGGEFVLSMHVSGRTSAIEARLTDALGDRADAPARSRNDQIWWRRACG